MRSFVPVLIGLATVAVAQNQTTDCITSLTKCYDFNTANTGACAGEVSHCKDLCSSANSNCLSSGSSKDVCSSRYNACVGAVPTSDASVGCLALSLPCYASASHNETNADVCESTGSDNAELCGQKYSQCLGADKAEAPAKSCMIQAEEAYINNEFDNDAAAEIATCKNTCGVLLDACMTSEDTSGCKAASEKCLGSGQLTESKIHCVAEVEAAIQAGKPDNDVEAINAQCKDACARNFDTCNSANNPANNATCLSYYSSCVGAKDLPTLTSNCVSNSESSYLNGTAGDNSQDSDLATCKSQCGYMYSTCLSSGDESVKDDCLSFYSQCTSGSSNSSSLNCVADVEQCYLDGTIDQTCDSSNAQCKNACTRDFSACTSSGDESVTAQCSERYQSCLGSSKLEPSVIDCVSRTEACYTSGKYTDAECDSQSAICKTTCSRSMDTCTSGGNSSSIHAACSTHYSQCLGSYEVSPDSTIDCVKDATTCFLTGDASASCGAKTAVCKSECSRMNDVCLSSGDASVKPGCQKRYDNCLGATPAAEEAAKSINCIERFTSCFNSGIAENECNSMAAQCKDTCSSLLDSCNSSGDNSTAAQCQGVYNSCLGSIATSLVDYKPLDCAGHAKLCASNGTASNQCDMQRADCGTACGITLDLCLVSGSSDKAACNHLYMMCQDASSYKVTSIPASLKPTVSLSSAPTAKSTAMITGTGSGAISTGGAYANGSSSTADAQSGAVSVATSTESTVYVTDIVKTTVTTCPVGQTLTTAGSTTVLTAPSVITTSVTIKSTISTTAVHTITVPAAVNNAVPTPKASTSIESTVYVTDVVKETVTTCPVGQTLTTAGSTTVLTAPSVITSKVTIQSTVSAVITHTASAPQSSPVAPEQTTPAPVDGHVAVPSTVTLYSTKEITITSCAADVTNCPARSTVVSTTLFPTAITVSSVWSRTSSASASGSAPAGSSPVSPETTSAPVTIASTMFYYSTAVVTVTSCAESVENCPARSTVVQTSVIPTGYAITSVISSAFTPIEYASPSAAVPESSAPAVTAPAPVVPTTAPFAVSNSTMMSVGPVGTGIVGTGSGSKATSTYSPSQYTGAANKVGAAGLAGVAAFAAFLI
ncbi:hypothetical protein E4T39_05851 [Aureobasidium subglaciale]|nr:hypothetical protein E4T39_05851 [Aureobasidium subglaciale]